jgi:preprotein translocase subunit SecA
VLEGADLHEQVRGMIDEVVASYTAAETSDGYPEEWDLDKLWRAFKQLYRINLTPETVIEEVGGEKANLTTELITEVVTEDAHEAYQRREEELTPDLMREIERRVVLSVLDRKWREHLYEMDYLREGIGLRAMAQRDPLVEYQREGYDMFSAMMDGIKEESVGNLFNLQFEIQENPIVEEVNGGPAVGLNPMPATEVLGGGAAPAPTARQAPSARQAPAVPPGAPAQSAAPAAFGRRPSNGRGRHAAPSGKAPATSATPAQPAQAQAPQAQDAQAQANEAAAEASPATGSQPAMPAGLEPRRPRNLQYSAPSEGGGVETRGEAAKDPYANVGRNAPCPCGSGKKFKQCHGARR